MGYRKHSFSHLATLGLFLSGHDFAIISYIVMHTNTHLYLCLFLKNKKDFPALAALAHCPLGQIQGGGGNRGSQVATGSAFQLQEPPPFSGSFFPSSLPHYSWKSGGLCSSHQLIPIECSRHVAHHGGQLTANPLFTEQGCEI